MKFTQIIDGLGHPGAPLADRFNREALDQGLPKKDIATILGRGAAILADGLTHPGTTLYPLFVRTHPTNSTPLPGPGEAAFVLEEIATEITDTEPLIEDTYPAEYDQAA